MKSNYYSLDSLKKYDKDITYYLIFGERGSGKSFSITRKAIDDFFTKGKEFVIVKRFAEDITTKFASTMLRDHEDYIRETYGYEVSYYGHRWRVYKTDGEKPKLDDMDVLGYTLAISQSNSTKGGQYPKVGNIILEEFMSMGAVYLPDEVKLFINLVSTIARKRKGVKVYMLGNPLNKISPYDKELGIKLYNMKKGEIVVKEFSDEYGRTNRVLVQRTDTVPVQNDGNAYALFGSNISRMIDEGDFETGRYHKELYRWTFEECLPELEKGIDYKLIRRKKHISNVYIRYADFWYQIYIVNDKNVVLGFRPVNSPVNRKKGSRIIIINNNEYVFNSINIVNLSNYYNESINKILDVVVSAFKQNSCVFMSDDNGEDVYNAFSQSGVEEFKS
jgi:hypothetical protein